METIALGASGRQTSRLGYGCSRLMGSVGRRESLALLEAAFDAGVRHFDVAPAYGHGDAESCVGEFLARHRDQITVATKYGVPIHEQGGLKFMLRKAAQPLFAAIPGLKRTLQQVAAAPASAAPGPRESLPFTTDLARASIEKSLVDLKTDRIDMFLLHEVEASDLTDPGLLRLLEDFVSSGKIGAFGSASGWEKISALVQQHPRYCGVLQHEWSVLDPIIPPGPAFRIHHRSLTLHFGELRAALRADKVRSARWSGIVGTDMTDGETLARLMLKAALICNPESVILFSSKKADHIRHNVDSIDLPGAAEQAKRLYSLVRAEAKEVIPASRAASDSPVRV
jgi:D-threo-aldose 1-dehydrogenase